MTTIIVLGAGIGGMCAAYELRAALGGGHAITVVGEASAFSFTPSHPWVALGWRKPADVQVEIEPALARRGIRYVGTGAARVVPQENRVELRNGDRLAYDYLVIATGPRLAFDEVPGLGPLAGHTQSVCTASHASLAWDGYEAFVQQPGPVVIGAAQGASCFGPAYEFALMVDTDLRRRKIRDRVPMTFVTSEPYVGHMGLGGVGDSRGLLERQFRRRHIRWITSAKIEKVEDGQFHVARFDDAGRPAGADTLPFAFSMVVPAFTGVDAVRGIDGLVNPRDFVLIDRHQRNPTFRNVFAAGVCVAIPPVEPTPVPTGAPKTGFMIESMVSAVVANLQAALEGREGDAEATWNAVCLADMGDGGAAFVALPQIPPRNVTWAGEGRWVHVAKVAYEKYFLRKMRAGTSEPLYERYVMKALGIARIKPGTGAH